MEQPIIEKLIELNRVFYQDFASSFSDTREKLQPGVVSITDKIPSNYHILDLGCGNGEFLNHLNRMRFHGKYTGVDFSNELLDYARQRNFHHQLIESNFLLKDLTSDDWSSDLATHAFDLITCFAALHHLPGTATRNLLLRQVKPLLKDSGRVFISTWQVNNSERLKKRILPWETIGLSAMDVDEGDILMDWRAAGPSSQLGMRYVHIFSAAELTSLAQANGFEVVSQYYSDGHEGNLALYQEWQPARQV